MTMKRLYLLLFEEEKILSIALGQYRIVPIFESEEDAFGYSSNVEESSRIISLELKDLINYARATSYSFKLVATGTQLSVPLEWLELVEWSSQKYQTQNLQEVYILLFESGKETEGVHSLKINRYDIVLLFEAQDDATRYCLLLEAQDFPTPTVEAILVEDAIDACDVAGYAWQIVKTEGLTLPPDKNLQQTDWQQDEPDEQEDQNDDDQEDLESIRRKLEGLL